MGRGLPSFKSGKGAIGTRGTFVLTRPDCKRQFARGLPLWPEVCANRVFSLKSRALLCADDNREGHVTYVGKVMYERSPGPRERAVPLYPRLRAVIYGPFRHLCGANVVQGMRTTSPMRSRSPMVANAVFMHRDVTYEENVTYGPTAKVRRRDSGSARHAIDRAAAQFRNCRARSF